MNPILRPASPEDISPAGTICYLAFKSIAEAHNFPPDFPDPESAIGLMRHLLSRTDRDRCTVVHVEHRPIGALDA